MSDEDRIKLLERSVERAWNKLDELVSLTIELKVANDFSIKRMQRIEDSFEKHMKTEEVSMALMNSKIAGLNQYKYVALGVAATILTLSNPTVLTLLEKLLGAS